MAEARGEPLCLHVLVLSAQNLIKKDLFGMCDPYVRVTLRRDGRMQSNITKTKKKTRNPTWNAKMEFRDVNVSKDLIMLEVFDEHRLTRDNFLGRVLIKLSHYPVEMQKIDITSPSIRAHTFDLKQRSAKSRVSGTIKLKLLFYNNPPTNRQRSLASLVPGAAGSQLSPNSSVRSMGSRQSSVASTQSLDWTMVEEEEQPLPHGWEQRVDANGRIFFVDHINRRTQWTRPQVVVRQEDRQAEIREERQRQFAQTMRRRIPTGENSLLDSPSVSSLSLSPGSASQSSRSVSPSPTSSPSLISRAQARQIPGATPPQRPLSTVESRSPQEEDLPPGWEMRIAPNGRKFYIDHQTRITQWHPPMHRVNTMPNHGRQGAPPRQEEEEEGGDLGPMPPGWEVRQLADGRMFYIDHNTKSTQWEDPRKTKKAAVKQQAMPYNRDFKRKFEAFHKKLLERKPENLPRIFEIPVRRDHIFEDSHRAIMGVKNRDHLKARMWVKFGGETGLDYGGLAREWFFLLSHEMLNPYYGLFEYAASDNYTLQINPDSGFCNEHHLDYFRFIGRIFGMAIYHKKLIDAFFIRPFYKIILGRPIVLADMEAVDTEFYNSVKYILDNDPEPLCLDFTASREFLGQVEEIELKPNGGDIAVTEENKKEYVRLLMKWRFEDRICKQMEAVKKGVNDVIALNALKVFDEREMEYLMCGLADINVDDWRKHTNYTNGYTAADQTIIWFWKAVENMDSEMRARLLQFVTGTSKVPMNGFAELQGSNGPQRFCIKRLGEPNALPRSHTCFNRIDLPPYRSYHELKEKLRLAIENTEGFEGVD